MPCNCEIAQCKSARINWECRMVSKSERLKELKQSECLFKTKLK